MPRRSGETQHPFYVAGVAKYLISGNKLYYIVSGGELRKVVLGVYGGKGVGMWCSVVTSCGVANFRPAVVSTIAPIRLPF